MLLRCFIAGLALVAAPALADPPALPALHADAKHTSVSGLSAGAYLAVQLQVAYSATIVGAGIVAGGPYDCAAGNAAFVELCMGQLPFFMPGASGFVGTAEAWAIAHEIDALSHLRHRRLYVFSGGADSTVRRAAVDTAVEVFRRLGVDAANIAYVHDIPAGHALIAPDATHGCGATESPFVNRCDVAGAPYDQAKAILTQIYGTLQPPAASPPTPVPFDQRPFGSAAALMADAGRVHVPAACASAGAHCRVHVALHGCMQAEESVGDAFHAGAGFNRWAETNRLIVLYPQVNRSASNPFGCWDWWGYSSVDYARKSAPQMKAIMAMVKRLTQR